jgi:CheY-like chemotaxis protein
MSEPRTRILLVDDYPDALETWGLFLELKGYDVLTAADGNSAVNLAVSHRPDVIVMDLDLPGITGYEAARLIRGRNETARIPLIAATGYSQGTHLDQARRAGFDSVLVKPCDPDLLIAEIIRLLEAPASTGQSHSDPV